MLVQKNKKIPMEGNNSPVIPEKLYFTIGEVSNLCQLKPHVLRYWEQEFPQLNPSKRRGNRRYYQRKDVLLVCKIKDLLYSQGYTIEGARQQLMAEHSHIRENTSDTDKHLAAKRIANLLLGLEEVVSILQQS